MRWFKVAAIGVGILIAFFVAMSVIGVVFKIITDLVIAAIVVGAIAVAIKVARSRRQVTGKKAEREVREPDPAQYNRPLPRADVEPVSTPYPPLPARRRRTWTTNWPGSSARWAASRYQLASASLVTAAWVPSMRTRAAVRRPITHMVSSAGLPTTVTAGVAFLAVIRCCTRAVYPASGPPITPAAASGRRSRSTRCAARSPVVQPSQSVGASGPVLSSSAHSARRSSRE